MVMLVLVCVSGDACMCVSGDACMCVSVIYSIRQINPELVSQFEEKGMMFVGRDVEGNRMEIVELTG